MDAADIIASLNLFHSTAAASDDDHRPTRRLICTKGCDRPINVCLCEALPAEPILTLTRVVILHHPHEQRHKLATVPVLSKCLSHCDVIVGRKLRHGDSEILDSLYDDALQNPNSPLRAIFLFPGTDGVPSMEISRWKSSVSEIDVQSYVLIAFDGTWKHAKEMVHASLSFLSKFAIQVCLNYDNEAEGTTIFDSDLTLRKEPFSGCMSTMEAVARCLRLLEPDGDEIELKIVSVLRTMVKLQASFLKPMKSRPKLVKRQKEGSKRE